MSDYAYSVMVAQAGLVTEPDGISCMAIGCNKEQRTREYCPAHYQRFRRHGDANRVVYMRQTGSCVASGCLLVPIARGLCAKHYQRVKMGRPLDMRGPEHHGEKTGGRVSPEYTAWQQMHDRCTNENSNSYKYYGGRGIRICEQWATFSPFLADVGRKPGREYTIDRVDPNGNYEPGNVRWATRLEQSRNRRPFTMAMKSPLTKVIEVDGICDSISGWARRLGWNRKSLAGRIAHGWSHEKAIKTTMGKNWRSS